MSTEENSASFLPSGREVSHLDMLPVVLALMVIKPF